MYEPVDVFKEVGFLEVVLVLVDHVEIIVVELELEHCTIPVNSNCFNFKYKYLKHCGSSLTYLGPIYNFSTYMC